MSQATSTHGRDGRRRIIGALTLILMLALLLGACSGSDDAAQTTQPDSSQERSAVDGPAGAPVADEHDGRGADGEDQAAPDTYAASFQISDARRIIRDAHVSIVVDDPESALDDIRSLARRAGGYVSEADLSAAEDAPMTGDIVIRVPAEQLEATLEQVSRLADHVESQTITSQDVTGQHADLTARLRNLRAYEAELLALLASVREQDGAGAEQLLSVFERIRQARQEIEQLEQKLETLEDLVALSTVRVHLSTPRHATVGADPEPWRPLEVLAAAGRTTLAALQWVGTAVIWLVAFVVPVALALGLPLVALPWLGRRWWRQRVRQDQPA